MVTNQSLEQKHEHVSKTAEYVNVVNDDIKGAALEASEEVGRLPHDIAYGLQIPMTGAAAYFEELDDEVSATYLLDPRKRASWNTNNARKYP
jgi:hypothetical protein